MYRAEKNSTNFQNRESGASKINQLRVYRLKMFFLRSFLNEIPRNSEDQLRSISWMIETEIKIERVSSRGERIHWRNDARDESDQRALLLLMSDHNRFGDSSGDLLLRSQIELSYC